MVRRRLRVWPPLAPGRPRGLETDDWWETRAEVRDVTLTVVSPSPGHEGETTAYRSDRGLLGALDRPVSRLIGRDAMRVPAGAHSICQPWDQAPDPEWWLSPWMDG